MQRLRHPNVVCLLKVCTRQRPLMLVLEYLSGGSLDHWLKKHGQTVKAEALVFVLHQVGVKDGGFEEKC